MKQSKMEELAVSIIHEIRNPLTTIKGLIQLLKPHLTEPNSKQYASLALSEIERTNEMLYQFLDSVKPQHFYQKHNFVINDLVEDIELFFQNEANESKITLEFEPENENRLIHGNENRLKQVLINIIRNSFDAIKLNDKEEQGKIIIRTQIDHPWVVISIMDNGCGMSNETLENLFLPYFSTKSTGTGIGLALCKEIIEEHEGKINFTTIEGEYTEVSIKLPAVL